MRTRLRRLPRRDRRRPLVLHRHRCAARMNMLRQFVGSNSLSLGFGLLFLASLVDQALAGQQEFSASCRRAGHGLNGGYVTSAGFAVDVAEYWQSEFLQFLLMVVAIVWLVPRGSPNPSRSTTGARRPGMSRRLAIRALGPRLGHRTTAGSSRSGNATGRMSRARQGTAEPHEQRGDADDISATTATEQRAARPRAGCSRRVGYNDCVVQGRAR